MYNFRQQSFTDPGELKLLQLREFAFQRPPNLFNHIGFSKSKIQNFVNGKTRLEHDGCINAAKWMDNGDFLLTGSDDRLVKVWQLSSSIDHVLLKHTIQTHHRGNIFCVESSRDDPNLVVSAAADGSVRTNFLDRPNAGTTLHASDDLLHMVQFDQEDPHVLYTAEHVGCVTRIDLRSRQKEVIFEHTAKVYENCPAYQSCGFQPILPKWSGKGVVKAIAQNPTLSTPHLLIGGKGYMVGFIDLRSSSRIPTNDGAVVNPFLKLWSPLFPMELDTPEKAALQERYLKRSRLHPFSRRPPTASASIAKTIPAMEEIGDSEGDSVFEDDFDEDQDDLDREEEDVEDEDEAVDEENEETPSMTNPSISNVDDDEDGGSSVVSHFRSCPMAPLNHVSVSGLRVSKDGSRILANFQNDQIYTFNFRSKETVGGVEAIIGGHTNHDTFLKTVEFFGPSDDFVVAGSDSGHLWVWESRPTTTVCNDYGVDIASTCCKTVGIFRADRRTCNGVVPHPTMPLLLSYGIDSDAKLWAYKTPDDPPEDHHTAHLGLKDSDLAHMSPSVAKKEQYDLCRHDGPRDPERYGRISIPLLAYPKDSIIKRSMYNYPSILENNKEIAKACIIKAFQPALPHMPQVVDTFDFMDTVFHQRLQFFRDHVQGYGNSRSILPETRRAYFTSDQYPYMPSDAVFHILVENQLFNEADTLDYAAKLCAQEKLSKHWKDSDEPHKVLKTLLAISRRRGELNSQEYRNFLMGMIHFEFHRRKNSLYNYLFMMMMELLRIAEAIKTIGNNAFRNKDLDCAHFFYCKAYRYFKHVLDWKLISPTIVRRKRETRTGPTTQFQETLEFSDGASVSMQVAMGPVGNLGAEIQRIARDTFPTLGDHQHTLTQALGTLAEGFIPNLLTPSGSQSNSTSTTSKKEEKVDDMEIEDQEIDTVDEDLWRAAFPDEWASSELNHSEDSVQTTSSMSEDTTSQEEGQSQTIETGAASSSATQENVEVEKVELAQKWTSRRLDNIVERMVELLYTDVAPEAIQTTLSNLAATFNAMEKYTDAVHVCNDAFQVAKSHKLKPDAKLLFRRGSASIQLHNYEGAMTDLQQALTLCPKDVAINNKLKEAKRLNEVKRKREIKAYSKMFE